LCHFTHAVYELTRLTGGTCDSDVASLDEDKESHEELPKPHKHLEFLITVSIDLSARHRDSKV
jgi:hypothetical protein